MSATQETVPCNSASPERLNLSEDDLALIAGYQFRLKDESDSPIMKVDENGVDGVITRTVSIKPEDREYSAQDLEAARLLARAQLSNCTGTTSEFANRLIALQVMSQSLKWPSDVQPIVADSTLALMAQVKPRDATEGMLAAQMVTTHNQVMRLHRLMGSDGLTVELLAMYGNLLSKLQRTYTGQMEALSRYRNQGQQKVTVVHKHIDQRNQGVIVSADKAQVNLPGIPEGTGGEIVLEGQPDATEDVGPAKRIAQSTEMPCSVEKDRAAVQGASS